MFSVHLLPVCCVQELVLRSKLKDKSSNIMLSSNLVRARFLLLCREIFGRCVHHVQSNKIRNGAQFDFPPLLLVSEEQHDAIHVCRI